MLKKRFMMILLFVMITCFASAESISPTTGLPIDGEPTAPMLAVISHTFGDTKVNGKTVKAAGVGSRQPWGGQLADIVYESKLYQDGASRFVYLYHDALVNGERIEAGPLRSVRDVHAQLSDAWNAGLIYSAGYTRSTPMLAQVWDRCFDSGMKRVQPYITTVRRRAPDHRSADVTALHELMAEKAFTSSGYLFTDDAPDAHLPVAKELHLQWGEESKQTWTTHFVYDEEQGIYLCYTGKAPLKTFHDTSFTDESQLSFANVIVQYANHSYPVSGMLPVLDLASGGRALILRGGRLQEARWVCVDGQTKFVDDNGDEIPLKRGRTYIAFWADDGGEIGYQ